MTIRRGARAAGLLPTHRDLMIIETVNRHGQMTRAQIQRLFFCREEGWATVQAVCRRLKLLTERGYLAATRLPALAGSGPYVYQLGRAASSLLREDRRAHPVPRRRVESAAGLLHGLEIVDYYIALKEALEREGGAIVSWIGEREAQCRFSRQGKRLLLCPDACCHWDLHGREGTFFLEWDRGSESMTRIAQKLDAYEAYYEVRAYRDHLGDVGLKPQLAIVVPDERRKAKLVGWLGRQLRHGRLENLPTVFVAARDPALSDVLGPIWHRPGDDHGARLVG